MNTKRLIASVLCLSLAACATSGANYVPVIDTAGVDHNRMQRDLAECQQYALQRANAAQGAVAGAVVGALLGAALGAAAGGNSRFNTRVAGVGAISGGVGAAGQAEGTQRQIIVRCMAGRGYNVLD